MGWAFKEDIYISLSYITVRLMMGCITWKNRGKNLINLGITLVPFLLKFALWVCTFYLSIKPRETPVNTVHWRFRVMYLRFVSQLLIFKWVRECYLSLISCCQPYSVSHISEYVTVNNGFILFLLIITITYVLCVKQGAKLHPLSPVVFMLAWGWHEK